MASNLVFGIDLGTTYSAIAYVDQYGQATICPNIEGDQTTPSVVWFENEDNIVVGKNAKEVASLYKDHVISTVKRAMGKPDVMYPLFGKDYTPQDVSALILRKVVKDAEENTGEKVHDVIITCPAYFGVNQKEATKQAGIIAGLNPLYIIPEPTAAAILYGLQANPDEQKLRDETVLVYDLGGGTFDISVIKVEGTAVRVISTGGDDQLGGKNWDDAIVDYFASCFQTEAGVSPDELLADMEAYQELLNLAETCKVSLTNREVWTKNISQMGHSVRVELTRDHFNQITVPLLERTVTLTKEMIEQAAKMGHANIDKLLLVGGSTYMPQVMDAMSAFSFEAKRFEPNLAVAKGAALFGHKCHIDEAIRVEIAERTGKSVEEVDIQNVPDDVKQAAQETVAQEHKYTLKGVQALSDMPAPINVASKSLGLVVVNEQRREIVDNLVVKDAPVPCDGRREYSTYEDRQTSVLFRLMENQKRTQPREETELSECTEIKSAELMFDRPMPINSPLEVIFKLSADGGLAIDAKDLTTLKQIRIEVEAEGLLTEAQLEAAKSRSLAKSVS